MRTHPVDALLMEKVCATLRNLSANGTRVFIRLCVARMHAL
jgi:hypothetical protein